MNLGTNQVKNIASQGLFFVASMLDRRYADLAVLGYHAVSHDNTIVDITPRAFKRQIAYLERSGYQFISLTDAYAYMQGKKKLTRPSIVLTFDDGYEDLLTHVVGLLNRKNIPATYFVISDAKYVNRAHIENDKKLFDSSTLSQLAKMPGADIQGHTTTHDKLYERPVTLIREDLLQSRKHIRIATRQRVDFFAYPWGIYNKKYIAALKAAKYKGAFTTEPGFIKPRQNMYLLPRIMIDRTHSMQQFRFMLTPLYPPVATFYFALKKRLRQLQVMPGRIRIAFQENLSFS